MPRPGDTATATPSRAPDRSTVYQPRDDLNLKVTLMWVKTSQRRRGVGWWATETPEGSASVAFRAAGGEVLADAWGPGAEWAINRVPALLGGDDDPSDFRPLDPVVRELTSRLGVPRLGATGRWFEAMATAAVYQRVVSADARTAVARLGRMYGAEVPGWGPCRCTAGCPLACFCGGAFSCEQYRP